MEIYFEDAMLDKIFTKGKQLPKDSIELYSGDIDKCALCNHKSIYFYIDESLLFKHFLCGDCLETIQEKRIGLLSTMETKFQELIVESGYESADEDKSCSILCDPELAEPQVKEPSYFIILVSFDNNNNNAYLISYDEFVNDVDNTDGDGYHFSYNNKCYTLPDEFVLL